MAFFGLIKKKEEAPIGEMPSEAGLPKPVEAGEETGLGMPRFGEEIPAPAAEPRPLGVREMPEMPVTPAVPAPVSVKDIELISAKLDAVRAQLESLNQRMANLERIAAESQGEEKKAEWE